ncbi:hypothetical protein Tco_1476239 [Tanacetum coccineum]
MMIYGRVMTFYQDKKAEGVSLALWGDLKILMDSPEVNDGMSGLVIHMFVDKKYPLTIKFIEKMLDHQLEICHGTMGLGMLLGFIATYFEQKENFSRIGGWLTTTQQMVFNSPCLTDKKEFIHHEGMALVVINSPCSHNKELASPEQTATAEVVPKSVAGSSFPAASSTLLPFNVQVQQDF